MNLDLNRTLFSLALFTVFLLKQCSSKIQGEPLQLIINVRETFLCMLMCFMCAPAATPMHSSLVLVHN